MKKPSSALGGLVLGLGALVITPSCEYPDNPYGRSRYGDHEGYYEPGPYRSEGEYGRPGRYDGRDDYEPEDDYDEGESRRRQPSVVIPVPGS